MKALLWVGLMAAISLLGYFGLCIAGPAHIEVDSRLECPIHPSLLAPALEGIAESHPWSNGPCRSDVGAFGMKEEVVVCSDLKGMEQATLAWWVESSEASGTQLHQRFHQPLDWWSRGSLVLQGAPVIPSLTCIDLRGEVTRAWGAGESLPISEVLLVELPDVAAQAGPSEVWWISGSGQHDETWSTFQSVSPGNPVDQALRLVQLSADTLKTWSGLSDETVAMALADFLSKSSAHSDSMASEWAVRRSLTLGPDTNETAPQWGTATLFEMSFRAGSMDQHAAD